MSDLIALVQTWNAKFETPLEEWLSKIMNQNGPDGQLVSVIYDGLMYVGATVANCLQLPSIIFHTISHSALLAYNCIPQLHEAGYLPMKDSMLQDLVPGLHSLRFKDLPISYFGTLESLMQLIADSYSLKSPAIICNAMKDLEHAALQRLIQIFQVPIFSVGPLFKTSLTSSSSSLIEEDTSCIEWLDKQAPNSVLYVSLGSIVNVDEKELAEMAWGLAHSGQSFLWVIRPGSVNVSKYIELPKSFETEVQERGFIVKWAPQKKVLAHKAIGGFWSHCGWNSTLESIAEGVPMICSPSFGDQKVNTRYVSNVWKIGLELDGELNREKMKAVRTLMTDKEGDEMGKRAIYLKGKLDICVDKEGSSYNSLNDWAQYISSL